MHFNARIYLKLISLYFAIIWNSGVWANEYSPTYNLRDIFLENNYVIPSTYSICQDSSGFMWFGSNEGLFRYDGRRLKGFLVTNSDNFIRKRINHIISSGSSLWLTAENELHKFNTINGSLSLCFRNPRGKSNLLNSCLDKEGNIWVRTVDDLYILKPVGDSVTLLGSLSESKKGLENIIGLQGDDSGQIWVRTLDGIYPVRLNKGNRIYIGNNLLPGIRLSDVQYREFAFRNEYLYVTTKNDLWIFRIEQNEGYFSAVLIKFIPDETIFHEIQQQDLHLVNIYDLIVDNNYNVLLNTELGLVVINSTIQDDASSQIINYKASQYILGTESMFLDRANNIYVGLGEQGVGYLNLSRPDINLVNFHLVPSNRKSDYSYAVNCLSEDNQGKIWYSSISLGLMRYNPGNSVEHILQANYRNKLDISDYKIKDLIYGQGDRIYLATYCGLDAYDIGSGKVINLYKSDEDPLSNSIKDICMDEWNRIWTIVEDPYGLFRLSFPKNEFNNPRVEDMNHLYSFSKDSSTRNTNRLFYNSRRNELLICQPKGLCKVSFDSIGEIVDINYYELAKPGPRGTYESLFINDVAFDENPVYYLATNGQGLICIEMQEESDSDGYGDFEAEYITMEEGLRSNFINSVVIDAEGYIWIASRGLMRWNIETGDLMDYSNDRQISQTLFLRESALRSKDEKVYFGTTKGLVYIDPTSISGKELFVKPVIADIRIGTDVLLLNNTSFRNDHYLDKEIAFTRELTLKYNDNKFVAEFAGLNYSAPELINFQYMLAGYDEDEGWVQTRNNAFCSYTNLRPGTYELKVKASGHDGQWNPIPAILTIRILPPWYYHPVAFISYSLLFLVILFIIIRLVSMRHGMLLNKMLYEDRMQLFTNISHELQTPISLIISPLEDLMRTKLPAEATRLIRLVNRNSKRILALNSEMIEIRKYESGNLQIEYERTGVNALISKIAELFVPISNSLGIEYNIIIPDEDINISMDNEKTTKIITNILSNAFKYTDQGGSVSISLFGPSMEYFPNASMNNQLKIPSQIKGGDFITVSIMDSGRGIQESDLPKIFNMFFKSDWNINKLPSGFGIGLSIVKNLAQLIGAELVVASKQGIGTDFIVKFPVRENHLKNDSTKEMDHSLQQEFLTLEHNILIDEFHNNHVTRNLDFAVNSINDKSILVVEDNLELLDYLSYRLSQNNYKIIKANNGYMALEQLGNNKPDLIITDWKMPRMNGLELIRNLKNNPETDHIPVIMLTNKFETEDNINATISGVDYYIRKPISMEFLLAKIKTIFDNRQRLKEKFGRDIYFDIKTAHTSKSDIDFLDKIVKIILDNVDNQEFDYKTICSIIGMSKSPFFSKIKTLSGQTPADFIKSIKLKLAARMLIEEGISIQEVTYRIGLENQSFFSQIFKKQFGKSPSEFVKSYAES